MGRQGRGCIGDSPRRLPTPLMDTPIAPALMTIDAGGCRPPLPNGDHGAAPYNASSRSSPLRPSPPRKAGAPMFTLATLALLLLLAALLVAATLLWLCCKLFSVRHPA